MFKLVKRTALAFVVSALVGFGAGMVVSPAPLVAGDCVANQKCKVNPEGDACVPGGTGCKMGIAICSGCTPGAPD